MTTSASRAWTAALAAVAAITVAPLFFVAHPPFTDLPEHVAVMASLRHWWDPAWRIQEHYVLAFGRSQYLLYHVTGALLSLGMPAETANRVLLAGVGVAFPFSFRALLRATGKDERLAVFAAPLFWNRALVVGFLPYVAAIPVMTYALALAVRVLAAPTRGRATWLAVVAVATFYTHASGYVLLVTVSVAWYVATTPRGPSLRAALVQRARGAPRALAWLVPSAICAGAWWAFGKIVLRTAESLSAQGEIGHMNALRTAHGFSLWTHDIWLSHVDEAYAVVYWLAFAAILVASREARALWRTRGRARELRAFDPAIVPFLCAVTLYFAIPFRVGAGGFLNVRMAPVIAMFGVLALPGVTPRVGRLALACVYGVAIAAAADATFEMRRIDREELADFDALVAHTAPGARLVSLGFHLRSPRVHFPPWVHVGAYHRARKGGVASYSFTDLAHWPLHYAPDAAPPPKPAFWNFHPCLYRNAIDGAYFDYVLARGLDPFRDRPPGPAWRVAARASDFTLYEKIPGESYPPWDAPDRGPCVPRVVAEGAAAPPAPPAESGY